VLQHEPKRGSKLVVVVALAVAVSCC